MKHKNLFGVMLSLALLAGSAAAKTSAPPLTGDDALTQKAIHEVRMYPYYGVFDDVSVRVENGTVHLTGEVTQPNKKSDIGKMIARVPGVTAVDNSLRVAPLSDFDYQLRRQVAGAIYRDPFLSRYSMGTQPSIHILVDNGHVTLEGVVRTTAEKQVAGMRANSSLSLGMVTNNLRVEQPDKKN